MSPRAGIAVIACHQLSLPVTHWPHGNVTFAERKAIFGKWLNRPVTLPSNGGLAMLLLAEVHIRLTH
jgi:hypothetical protein